MAPHIASAHASAAGSGAPSALPSLTPAEIESLQAQEVEVLASILGDDFSVASTRTAWKAAGTATGAAGQEYHLILRPEEESLKPHLSVVMRLRLPKRYPIITPIFTLEPNSIDARTQGISEAQRKALEGVLGKRARELLGAEMIWELVEIAQEWITRNNQVILEGDGPVRSLEEERDERAREQEMASRALADAESIRLAQEEAERARKLAALIEEQSALRTAAVAEERNRKKAEAAAVAAAEQARSPGVQEQSTWLDRSSAAPASQDIQMFLDPIEWQGGFVHQVKVGSVLSTTNICCVHLASPMEEAQPTQGKAAPWALEKFTVDSAHYELVSGRRELETIEWELDRLHKVRHPALLNVVATALVFLDHGCELTPLSVPSVGRTQRPRQVLVLREPSRGPTAAQVMEHAESLPWSKVRSHMHALLEATQALHTQNLIHRGICLDHVHLEPKCAILSSPSVKLGGGGYMRRLQDMNAVHPLCSSSPGAATPGLPPSWEAPESREAPATYSRKRDVWDLAVTVLQMLLGTQVVSSYTTPEEALASQAAESVPPHVLTLLASMLERATKRRPLVADVLTRLNDVIAYEDSAQSGSATEAPRGALAIPDKPSRKLSAAHELAISPPGRLPMDNHDGFRAKPGSFWQLRHPSNSSRAMGGLSRYENDFVELELLGKGAYGAVYKAQNRLDGRHYAIKKIKLSSSVENDDRTLREITALSRLNHTHIVRYVTCWIQEDDMASGQSTSSSGGALTSTASKSLPQSDEVFQVGFRDDDFLSMGHDAFSKGADIHFGNDDDSDSESDEDGDETASETESGSSSGGGLLATRALTPTGTPSSMREPSRRSRHTTQQSDNENGSSTPLKPRWLYVQMELVENQTLREMIDKGLSIDEAWRLFRQVLEALVHIHSLGIIHRDLKPSNILLELSSGPTMLGHIKIGDFGLATTAQMAAAVESAAPFGTGDHESASTADLTSNLGTNLYIAPEVLNVRKGSSSIRYGTSVDLYAAGIIFFEMLAAQRVYKTGMERVAVLRELRGEDVCLPGGWPEAQLVDQTKIIRWLLNHDPSKRPTALELLKSDLMPAKLEDEVLAECMRLMANPASVYNHKMLSSLFERDEPEDLRWARDFTFDAGTEDSAGQDHRLVAVVTDHLRSIFHRHGAIELGAPLLVPPNGIYGNERRPVQMLDKTGRVVELPFDLVVPFARLAARADTRRLKRFQIAPVYRQNVLAGGQPRSVLEVDFDIVSPERTTAAEGEVLALVDEILQSTPGLHAEDFVVLISHSEITNMVLQRVPPKQHSTALAAFAAFSSKASAATGRAKLLELALPRSVIDEIEAFNLCDDIVTVHARLERLVALDLKPKLARAVDELARIIQSAKSFGAHCRFLFTPLLVSNSVYRGGCHFQVVRSGKRRDVLASGGRYDTLIRQLANPTASLPPPHAVGVQLAVGRIALAVARYQELNAARLLGKGSEEERSFGLWTPRRCDVYVAANGPGLLNVRMEVCRELWAAGISADLAYEHAVAESTEVLAATCRSEGILFLVSVRSEHSASCKVRSIIHNEATEVRRHELVSWLGDQIARQRTVDVASSSTPMPGTRGAPVDSSRGSAPSAPLHQPMGATSNVNLLMPERQSTSTKKAERHRDERRSRTTTPAIGKAAKHVAKLAEESGSLPVLAVDFEGASFERLCAALVFGKDDFAWKALLESLAGTEEKDYARLVRDHVAQVGRAWLYSIREDRAALVQC